MALLPTNIATGNSSHIAYTNQINKKTNAWVDVKTDFGAAGDGITDDTLAIHDARNALAALGGGVLFFPPGTYATQNPYFSSSAGGHTVLQNVTVMGAGRKSVLKRSLPNRLDGWHHLDANYVRYTNLAFDLNNVSQYGGLDIQNCENVQVDNCFFFDSNLDASWSSFDHFGPVIIDCHTVSVRDCIFEDCQLEIDNSSRATVTNNLSMRAAGTMAIGFLPAAVGQFVKDFICEGNMVYDPRKNGIYIATEQARTNTIVRNISIRNNTIIHAGINPTGSAVLIGQTQGTSGDTSGQIVENLDLSSNRIWGDSSRSFVSSAIAFYHVQTGRVFRNCRIKDNLVVRSSAAGEWTIDLRKFVGGEVTGNIVDVNAYGIALDDAENVLVDANGVTATTKPVQLSNSAGNNIFSRNRIYGSPSSAATYSTTATDKIIADHHGNKTTANRPTASSAGAGAQYYDTTLSKPVWSDGTNWKDAAGTTV